MSTRAMQRDAVPEVPAPSTSSGFTYRPALDGLRTVAVYLVVLFHAGLPWFEGGFIGVDLFFALSGFLVCNVVLSEVDKRGKLRLGNFYARRVRRLLPAAVLLVVVASIAYVLVAPPLTRETLPADARGALLYYSNWHFLAQAGDYFATDVEKSPFLHFWSLSIEEQYYLLFPLVVIVLVALRRLTARWLLTVLGLLTVASLAAQVHWAQVDVSHAYYGTEARLYQLVAGALLAVVLREWPALMSRRTGALLALAGLVGLVVAGSSLVPFEPSARGMLATAVSMVVIAGLSVADGSAAARVLSHRVPVHLGQISYGTYLWHWPVILVLGMLAVTDPLVVAGCTIVVGTACAAASYHLLEMPIRTSRRLVPIHWPTVVVGVAASALVALTVVPMVLQSDREPLEAAQHWPAEALPEVQPATPVPEDFDPATARGSGHSVTCGAEDPSACTVVASGRPHVLVVGDSQGLMFGPMFEQLAREHGFQLSMNVLPGCAWQENLVNTKQSAGTAERCAAAREGWYEEVLPRIDPDVVVLTTRDRDDEAEWGEVIESRDGTDRSLHDLTRETTEETLGRIVDAVPTVVVSRHLPMPETFNPNACLTAVDDARRCAAPRSASGPSFTDSVVDELAAEMPQVQTVDLGPAFCVGKDRCEAYVDGIPVFRDNHHYSMAWIDHRLDEAWKILGPALR